MEIQFAQDHPAGLRKQSDSRTWGVNLCTYPLSAKIRGLQFVCWESFSSRKVMQHLSKCWQRCTEEWKRKARKRELSEWLNLSTHEMFTATPTAAGKCIMCGPVSASPPPVALPALAGPGNGSELSHILSSSVVLMLGSNEPALELDSY